MDRAAGHGFRRVGAVLAADPALRDYVAALRAAVPDDPPSAVGVDTPDGLPPCDACRGRRWLRADVDVSHPDFGRIRRCPACRDATAPSDRERVLRVAGLSEAQRGRTFEAFRPVAGSEGALAAAAAFSEDPDGWLVLRGVPGSGKTHLGLAIANRLLDRGVAARWWYAQDLLERCKGLIDQGGYAAFLSELKESAVLILDDLGVVYATAWGVAEILEPLFDARYRHRRPLVVTLIGTPRDVREVISESIGRRMQDPAICRVVTNAASQWGGG